MAYSGREIAGCPVTLKAGVKGTTSAARNSPCSGLSTGESNWPSNGGGSAIVGVRRRSKPPSYHCATWREIRCSFWRASRKSEALAERPASASAHVRGSTSSSVRGRPSFADQWWSTSYAVPADHTEKEGLDELGGVERRQLCRLDHMAERFQQAGGGLGGRHAVGVRGHGPAEGGGLYADAEATRIGADLVGVGALLRRCRVGVPRCGPRHGVEHRRGVAYRPGHRQLAHQATHHVAPLGPEGHARPRRLESHEPALAGGDADGPAPVVGVAEGHHA